jgi:osmotically-inducible protein OsmY
MNGVKSIKTKDRSSTIISYALALALVGACALVSLATDKDDRIARTEAPKHSPSSRIDDASITAQVNMSLLNHRSTSVLNITVKTKRGVVTVVGKGKNAAELNLVTKLATDIHGVKSVKNLMTIG